MDVHFCLFLFLIKTLQESTWEVLDHFNTKGTVCTSLILDIRIPDRLHLDERFKYNYDEAHECVAI